MKIALIIAGGFLVVFGLVDLIGSFAQFDLWGTIGIQLPDVIWSFSAYIEILLGAFLFKLGLATE
jgi:uncharacterized membrane protein YphA (DoxX/SURF4 family)